MADVRVLDVLLHGELVGTLTHIDGDRTIFGFADAYVANDRRPALGLGFKDRFGELITEFIDGEPQDPPVATGQTERS